MTNLALFGAGRIGQIHARTLAALPGVTLSYLVDPVQSAARDQLAQGLNARIVTPDVVFGDPKIDGVVIASATDSHAHLLRAAVQSGKPVFCEKPISLDFATVQDIARHVAAADLPVMMGFQRRYDPNFRAVQQRIASGQSGRLEQLIMHSRDPVPPALSYVKSSGGFMRDSAIHDFDQARFMTGEDIVQVFALGTSQVSAEIGAAGDFDTLSVLMTSASGRMIHLLSSRRGPMGYDQRLEAHCARESLFIENATSSDMRIEDSTGAHRAPPMAYFIERFAQAYAAEMEAFVAMIQEGRAPLADLHDGVEAQRLAEAALASIASGAPVAVSPQWHP